MRPLLRQPRRERAPWPARLAALLLGIAGPVVLAVSVRTTSPRPPAPRRDATERVVAIAVPDAFDGSETSAGAPVPGIAAPTTPDRPRAGATPAGVPPSRDSARGSDPAMRRDAAGTSTIAPPAPRDVFRSPMGGAPCLPSCGAGPTVAGGDGSSPRAGAGIVWPPMTKEQRDSVLRAMGDRVADATAGAGPASSLPPRSVGVSIQVGLPGGGPTRAQRERARALDADVTARLARIRARADSLAAAHRRDSVARASVRRDSSTSPG